MGEHLDAVGGPAEQYMVCKRDSYVIFTQRSPEFTARLVDRWHEMEASGGILPGMEGVVGNMAAVGVQFADWRKS